MQGSGGEDSPSLTESIAEQTSHGLPKSKAPVEKPEEFINRKAQTPSKKQTPVIDTTHSRKPKQPKPMRKLSESLMAEDSLMDSGQPKLRSYKAAATARQTMEEFGSFDKTTNNAQTSNSPSPKKDNSKKRHRDTDDSDDVDPSPQELAQMSRSERKKFREKKRRSEVNKGFDELMDLLIEIDPEVRSEAEERARRGQWKGALGAHEENLLNRVDLIGRTVKVLSRLYRENEERKKFIENLTRGGAAGAAAVRNAASNEQASIMMPMLSTSDAAVRMSRRPPALQDSTQFSMPNLLASSQLGFPTGDFLGFGGPQGVPGLSSLTGTPPNSSLGGSSGLNTSIGGTSRLIAALGGLPSNLPAEYLRMLQQQHAQQSGSGAPQNGGSGMGQRFSEGRGL